MPRNDKHQVRKREQSPSRRNGIRERGATLSLMFCSFTNTGLHCDQMFRVKLGVGTWVFIAFFCNFKHQKKSKKPSKFPVASAERMNLPTHGAWGQEVLWSRDSGWWPIRGQKVQRGEISRFKTDGGDSFNRPWGLGGCGETAKEEGRSRVLPVAGPGYLATSECCSERGAHDSRSISGWGGMGETLLRSLILGHLGGSVC